MTEPVPERVVVTPDRGVVPADTPVLAADDLGVLRGDGVFETMHVRRGEAWLLEEHLARMRRSAARLALDLPGRDTLAWLAGTALAAWPATAEGALRLVCTRGREAGGGRGPVTVFATLAPVPPAARAARRDGIAAATATLGVPATVRPGAPWLLGAAKTVSYAVNMATLRWAYARGLDDVLWVSVDGYALEAPTASLVWQAGEALCTVPAADTGILPGITVRWLLDRAGTLGLTAAERMVRPEDLAAADGVWLVSSVRGPAPVRELDGVTVPRSPHAPALRELLGHPV